MAKRTTLGTNPLDTIIGGGPTAAAKASRKGLALDTSEYGPKEIQSNRVMKERLTVHLPLDLIDRIKNAVYWTAGLTLAGLAEEALEKAIEAIEKKNGKPFPKRERELKGGRPLK